MTLVQGIACIFTLAIIALLAPIFVELWKEGRARVAAFREFRLALLEERFKK